MSSLRSYPPPGPAFPLPRLRELAVACALLSPVLLSETALAEAATSPAQPSPAESGSESAAASAADASRAQARATTGLPTVTVTAEKRETALADTPLSVSAVSADDLERNRSENLKDLMGQVPGLVAPGSISNMQALFIRGIGTSNPGFYPAVAVYVDDIYRPRPFGVGTFSLPDIERIEILRGPQGTLYGQNSSAGAVKFVSRDPGDTPEASLSLGIGTDGYHQETAYLAAPIKQERLSLGLALASRRTDGYTYNAYLGKQVDAVRLEQARLKLKLTPGEQSSAVLSLDYGRDRSDNALYVPVGYPGAGPRTTYAGIDTQLGRIDKGVSLQIQHALNEALTLKSISGYRRFQDNPSPWDQDGTPDGVEGWTQYIDQDQFSQELQLSGDYARVFFTVGAVYFRENLLFDRLTVTNNAWSELYSDLSSESLALYGQARIRLTDALGLTAGLRLSRDEQSFANDAYRNRADGSRTALLYSVSGLRERWNSTTPKLGLDYRFADGTLGYASITRGAKIGGYNRAASTAAIASVPVGPEEVTAYEAGAKRRFLDDRIEASAAAFYNDFQDYQANVTNPTVNGQYITGSVLVNAAKARTWGLEFEGAARISADWDIRLSAAYLRTRFGDFQNPTGAASSDYTGNELPTAPRWTYGLSTVYQLPWTLPGSLSLSANLRYIGEQWSDIGNTAVIRVDPQTYVGAGIQYRTRDGHWTASLTSQNALDRTYPVNLKYRAGVSNQAAYSPPRQTVLAARYDW